MPEELNNDEPSLESFNEPAQPAPASTDDGKKASETDPAPTDDGKKAAEPTAEPKADDKKDDGKVADTGKKNDEDIYSFIDSMSAEGIKQDPEAVKQFKEIAKANNLTPEAAKAIAEFQLNAAKKQADAFKDLQKSWEDAAKVVYGENLKNVETNCSRVLAELDKEGKFKELLALVGAEKHPATLGFLKAVGDKMLEKPAVNPNATVSGDEHEPELEDFN